jgi:hypothetical protein
MTSPALKNHDLTAASLNRASAHLAVLEILATFGKATTRQIARFRFGNATKTQEERTARIVASLRDDGLVVTLPTGDQIAQNARLKWFVPVHGLTEFGVTAAKHYDMGDPKPFEVEHSLLTLDHELKISDTQYELEQLCKREGWAFSSQQTDLYRTIEPDRLFGIKKPGGTWIALPYEEENKKKTHEDLYAKAARYYDYWNTAKCEHDWGWFRQFHVLWQFPNEERMMNFVRYLAGDCQCHYYRGKKRHTCLPHGLRKKPLLVSNFLFTHDALTRDIGGKIWVTPKDSGIASYSLNDL